MKWDLNSYIFIGNLIDFRMNFLNTVIYDF